MSNLTYDEGRVRLALGALDARSRVAFALSCAERLLPNHRAFVRDQAWGRDASLRQALDLAWRWLRGEAEGLDLAALKLACEAAAPDTEDFDSLLVSPALDAANAAALVIELIQGGDPERACEVAFLARDTVDMYVQEVLQISPNAADLEERIRQHPLMQTEIARQQEDLSRLQRSWNESEIRQLWYAPAASSIGLH